MFGFVFLNYGVALCVTAWRCVSFILVRIISSLQCMVLIVLCLWTNLGSQQVFWFYLV